MSLSVLAVYDITQWHLAQLHSNPAYRGGVINLSFTYNSYESVVAFGEALREAEQAGLSIVGKMHIHRWAVLAQH